MSTSLYQCRDEGAISVQFISAAAVCAGCVCVCEGCMLHVRANQLKTFTFSHEIDAVECGRGEGVGLAAVGDRSGCLHIISLTTLSIVHSQAVEIQSIPCNQPAFSSLDMAVSSQGLLCLLAMARSGYVYFVHCLHESLSRELPTGEVENMEVIQMNLETVHAKGSPVVCALYNIVDLAHIVTVGGPGPYTMAMWRVNNQTQLSPSMCVASMLSVPGTVVLQAEVTHDGCYIVTRTQQCEVQLWLVEVMVLLGVWGGRDGQPCVTNLSLYCHGGQKEHRLCVLCCHPKRTTQEELVVLNLPGLKKMYSTLVATNSLLAVGQPRQETVCVLQPELTGDTKCVRVTILEYSSPQDRVAALVREGKFEEAEQLVQEHHLDTELVVYEKAAMLNQLVCAGEEGQLPAFLQCLRTMKDVSSTAELILQSLYPSLAVVHSVLTVLCEELAKSSSGTTQSVAFALDRLITFSLIAGQEGYSCETWRAFQKGSCVQIVRHLLQLGRTQHAQIFWSRHQVALYVELTSLDMCTVVQLIPANMLKVVSWLSATILPYLVAHRLHQMREFVVEFREVLCSLEVIDQANWPANALSLAEQILPLILEMCPCPNCPPDLSPLTEFRATLIKLSSILTIIQCPLSLTAYEQSSTEQLIYRALDQTITPDSLQQLITEKLNTFSEEHQLNLDTVLSNYLKLFLTRAPTHSSDFPGSPWEVKAVALAHNVRCTDLRVVCCVEVLQSVTVPWSKEVTDLVHHCLPLDRVGELHSLHDLLQLKVMLQDSYGIMDFNFSDRITGELYIRHMLLQGKPHMLADTLRVASMYKISESKVYMHHLYNLCCQNQIEEARDLLCSLSPRAQTNTSNIALSFCLHRLKFPNSPGQSDPASHCGAAQLAVLCTDVLSFSSPAADWSGGYSREQLLRVRDLAVDFSLFLSPEQLASHHYTKPLLLQSLSTLSPSLTRYFIPCSTRRLGRMLGYSEYEVNCLLAELWLQQVDSLALIEDCPAHLTLPLLHSVLCTSDWSSLTSSLTSSLYKMVMHICTTCAADLLSMAVHIFRACSFLYDVLILCKLERDEEEETRTVPWPWVARISQQGLLLQLATIRPTCLQLTSALLQPPPHSSPDRVTVETCCSTLVQLLQSNGHFSLAYHTAVQGHLYLGTTEPCVPILTALLEKVLSMTRVDHSYGLALLMATPQSSALHLLHSRKASILTSYSRVIALCILATDYCQLVCLPQVRATVSSLKTSALWGKHLRQYQVSFSAAFKGGNEEKRKVLSQLLHLKHVPPQLLLAYCKAFGLNGPGALLTRLRVALTELETGYKVACEAALTALGKHPFIPSLLNTFLTSKVCPYDYERIQFVLQQLLHKGLSEQQHKMQLLLAVLVTYDRSSHLSAEEQVWHSSHCHSVCKVVRSMEMSGTTLAKLPLHMLLDPKYGLRLLSQEFQHVTAVTRLAPIASLMNIPDDQFYCNALKSLVALETNQCSFQELCPLLTCISHVPTRLSLTVWLTQQLSSDKDRVAALEVALCLLQDHTHSDSLIDANSLHQQLCEARVRLVLMEAGLGRYCQLAGDGAVTIITSLYIELPLQKDKPSAAMVHEVVEKIAGLHGANLLAITSQLLEEWLLPSTTSQHDLNSTLVREMAEVEKTEEGISGEKWTRMVYLLTDNCDMEQLAAVLYRWTIADSPVLGSLARTTAMQLLLTVIPPSVLTNISGGTEADLREQVQCAVFVAELAAVQVSLTVETFRACSKQTLASNLLHSRANSPKALRLAVELCQHYRVRDPSLWAPLLDALLALNMTGYLQRVLTGLVGLGAVQTVSNPSSVWQSVVLAPYHAGGAGGADCLAALHFLYMCPLLFQLDLPTIVQAMAGVGAHSHALSACMLLAPTLRTSTVKSVMKDLPSGGLSQLLDEITISSSPELSLVADVVYDYVDQTGQHGCLLGTPHFPHLVQYLICHHRLTSLLEQSLTRGRISEAVQLVGMYHSLHSSSAPTGMDGLKIYLTVHGLPQYLDKLTGDRE